MTIECDELWSFVGKKQNKQWVWLATDSVSGEIVIKMALRDYGIHSRLFIVSVRWHTPISGSHMHRFSLRSVIRLSEKAAVRQIISNG
ncbi:hypothetical protein DENIS_3906 [Desulfonema ishimotonii]|uniref:Transposase n=1 Tax=Desulfonema ishimotonii TaxID=45657 RepID=A0A401G120_9BACT|nr:hypothetical protein DENIS_3906 [Desulfonema ishimotonii]